MCNSDLQGKPIPHADVARGWYPKGVTHYSRTIGVQVSAVYDGVLYWRCPDCGGSWHRWPEGHRLRERAQEYIDSDEPEPHRYWGEAEIIGDDDETPAEQ